MLADKETNAVCVTTRISLIARVTTAGDATCPFRVARDAIGRFRFGGAMSFFAPRRKRWRPLRNLVMLRNCAIIFISRKSAAPSTFGKADGTLPLREYVSCVSKLESVSADEVHDASDVQVTPQDLFMPLSFADDEDMEVKSRLFSDSDDEAGDDGEAGISSGDEDGTDAEDEDAGDAGSTAESGELDESFGTDGGAMYLTANGKVKFDKVSILQVALAKYAVAYDGVQPARGEADACWEKNHDSVVETLSRYPAVTQKLTASKLRDRYRLLLTK